MHLNTPHSITLPLSLRPFTCNQTAKFRHAPWWHLIIVHGIHLATQIVDWLWLLWWPSPGHRPIIHCPTHVGMSWPLGSSLAQGGLPLHCQPDAPEGAAQVARGTASSLSYSTPWAALSINVDDPHEVHLATLLRQSAVEHVASSSANQYDHARRAFVRWCQSLQVPRSFLPASEVTVALT